MLRDLAATPVRFIEPVRRGRSVFTESRLAVFADGSCCTVLAWLAWKKFGVAPDDWSELDLFPFWRDGNRQNETLENVDIAARTKHVTTTATAESRTS
jgi:hypothetical protein